MARKAPHLHSGHARVTLRKCRDMEVVLHTDGAKSYRKPERYMQGVLHDFTVQSKRLVNGQVMRPKFAELWRHTLPEGTGFV